MERLLVRPPRPDLLQDEFSLLNLEKGATQRAAAQSFNPRPLALLYVVHM